MGSQNIGKNNWNIDTAKNHYRISRWGLQHFDINSKGNVVAKAGDVEIDLYELSQSLKAKGIGLPVLVRFPQILQQSLHELSAAFQRAIQACDYKADYIAAYPIKVNQQATVIQHYQQQSDYPIAFEVGSKAELIACLGTGGKQQTIICNGYKDEAYIRLALIGRLLGHEVIIVLESLNEFQYVLKQGAELDVQATLGMRVRLTSIAKGNWQNTGGEHSKFGLTSNDALSLVGELKSNDVLVDMKMLHFHMGSQISCLQDIKMGLQEGMHIYAQLEKYGIKFEQLNIGGGLAVDYEGGRTDKYFSMDYSINEYAATVVNTVHSYCDKNSISAPTIFSENGRAMTAHHAVLMTNVLNAEYQEVDSHIDNQSEHELLITQEENTAVLNNLINYVKDLENACVEGKETENILEIFHHLKTLIKNIDEQFAAGELSLLGKARSERLVNYAYWKIINSDVELEEQDRIFIEDKFVAKYFCNFSLFQSAPDIWGLKQIFPIMPLQRNNEKPVIKSRIYDLTCDSDGRIDQYVEADSVQPYLSLHPLNPQQDYILGIFLVGAYQEILGDMHNLFGDTHAVNIVINTDGSYQICDEERGDTIEEILSYLHIDTGRMRQAWLDRLSDNNILGDRKEMLINELAASLHANSYLS